MGQKQPSVCNIEIRIIAEPEWLCVARAAVKKAAERSGLAEDQVDAVTLAIDEALTNVIRHSYGGPCQEPIIVTINKYTEPERLLEFVIRDFGKQVDPKLIKGRDLTDVKPGGLGVHIIKSIMDAVEYSPIEDGGMQLRMVKNIDNPKTWRNPRETESQCPK